MLSEPSRKDQSSWGFYGRTRELAELVELFSRGRWFMLRVSGRRRIGKTALVRRALREAGVARVAYLQVEDADPAGVVALARRHLALSGVPSDRLPVDLPDLAARVADLAAEGWVVILDEYQYFHRKSLTAFNGYLQFEVDRLAHGERPARGGLVLLGSIQTEMAALLDDRRAPLFGRATASLHLSHLEPGALLEILRAHGDPSPEQLLFTWTLLQGVPKYWRDAYEEGVLGADRETLLERLFFKSSAPLREEGVTWLGNELRGRYDVLLRYVSAHPDCTTADISAHVSGVAGHAGTQTTFYLKALEEQFHLIEKKNPIFAPPRSRSARFALSDNFLASWLGGIADPVALEGIRDTPGLVREASEGLKTLEGQALERLVSALYASRSRAGLGDFPLTELVRGWWDRAGTEIDLVAVDDRARRLRLGSCKRSPDRLVADLGRFNGHIDRFLEAMPRFRDWAVERVALAPRLTAGHRAAIQGAGYLAQDLVDLTEGL